MSLQAMTLKAGLELDSSNFDSGLAAAQGKASTFGDTLKGFLGAQVIQQGFNAIKGGFESVVDTGMSFDSSMSQVAATMGKTMSQMEGEVGSVDLAWGRFSGNLRDYAQEMGKNTAFSATEAADALNYMALAGYDTQTSMEMLPNVLNLAAAGNMDLARASDMVTDTQTAFGISLERTSQMVDEMAKAASTGNTSVEQLGDAFLTVGGLAKNLNGGFVLLEDGSWQATDGVQELEIALTAMANAGIKGSEAGTHMRNMLLKLSSPTEKGTMALEALGVSVFDAEGNMRALSNIFYDLNESMGTLTQEEKLQAISDLFNTRDIASAEALLSAVEEDWDEIGRSILEADGAAQQMADTQLDNLAGDITLFKSALEGAQIAISDLVAPALRGFVEEGTTLLSGFTSALTEGGVGGALTFLESHFDALLIKANEVFPGLVDLWLMLQDIWKTVVDFIASKSGDFGSIFETIQGLFKSFVDLVTTAWEVFGEDIMKIAEDAWNFIKTAIESAMKVIQGIINIVTGIISGDWSKVWEGIKNVAEGVWNLIKSIIEGVINNISSIIGSILSSISSTFSSIWNGIKETVSNVVNSIKEKVSNVFTTIKDTIKQKITDAKNTVSSVFTAIKDKIKSTIETARDKVHSAIEKIKSFFKFEWSLPKLKLPHLNITGSFSLMPPSAPSFSIEWYKKAYNNAYLFDKPTVGVGLGFGDGVGGEMVVGEAYLQKKIGDAMEERVGNLAVKMDQILSFMQAYFPEFAERDVMLDGDVLVGRLAGRMDKALGRLKVRKDRG